MKILRILKSKPMTWYNIWKWPTEVIDDVRQWLMVRSAIKEPETKDRFAKFKYELRTDKIGRIYTVINIPEELLEYAKRDTVWPWVLEEINQINELLIACRLNDVLYPEVVPHETEPAYIVILTPSTESLSIWKFMRWIFNVALLTFVLFIINRITLKAAGLSAIDLFLSLF
jgi:hypothetical protein